MKNTELLLVGCNGIVVYNGRLTNFPINEALILKKSIEFFNDPEPCFIHKSAVMKRLYLEAEEFLEKMFKTGMTELQWEDLPYNIRSILQQDIMIDKVKYVML